MPDDVYRRAEDPDFSRSFVLGRCGHGCENVDSFTIARERVTHTYLYENDVPKILVLNMANLVHPGGGVRELLGLWQ